MLRALVLKKQIQYGRNYLFSRKCDQWNILPEPKRSQTHFCLSDLTGLRCALIWSKEAWGEQWSWASLQCTIQFLECQGRLLGESCHGQRISEGISESLSLEDLALCLDHQQLYGIGAEITKAQTAEEQDLSWSCENEMLSVIAG